MTTENNLAADQKLIAAKFFYYKKEIIHARIKVQK